METLWNSFTKCLFESSFYFTYYTYLLFEIWNYLAELGVDWFLHESVDQLPSDSCFLNEQLLILTERINSQELLGDLPGLPGSVVATVSFYVVPETQDVREGLTT